MKRLLTVLAIAGVLIPLLYVSVPAQAAQLAADYRPFGGEKLCLPDVYFESPDHCVALGPSQVLSGLAKQGLTYPVQPLPVERIQAEFSAINYLYALADKGQVPTYLSLEDAAAKRQQRMLPAGRKYLSYTRRVQNESGVFYQIQTGEWVSGENIETRVSPSTVFRGVLVQQTPRTPFGWVLDATESRVAPDFNAAKTGKKYERFKLVWAYSSRTVNGVDWVLVGVNEWLEQRQVARVIPGAPRPEGVTADRWIEVNLAEQTLSVYDAGRLKFATLISSGAKPFYTRMGVFPIYKKLNTENMSGSFEADRSDYYYLENVPFTMYFDGARALHGVYWHSFFGYVASHGCVNLSVADAHWLFDWAKQGDQVYVWDASGKTPTDVGFAAGP